jgi:DHA1 family bicyclomycin/chloramphenicol resistance-like MFS transporter
MQSKQSSNDIYEGMKPSYFYYLVIFLGLLSAFGPFITDMYLPALPAMMKDFNTNEAMVQFSLTMGMIGLAVGQIFFGPISQKWGRRPVLIATLTLFILAAVACLFSETITFFLICRLFQGLGGAGGIVLSRSIATDCYSGRNLAKMMAIIGAVNGIAPATAPVVGGLVSNSIGWIGVFLILAILGVILLLMTFAFKETLKPADRFKGSIFSTFKEYPKVCRIRRFVMLVLCYGFSGGVLFSYISAAPFIIQQHFNFNEIWFAIVFGINSVLIGVGSGVALKFKQLEKAMAVGCVGMVVFAALQLCGALVFDSFIVYEATSVFMLFFLGMAFTTSTSMAMDQGRQYIGAASAIVGAVGFVFGGIVSPIVGMGNIPVTCACALIICSAIALAFASVVYRHSAARESV